MSNINNSLALLPNTIPMEVIDNCILTRLDLSEWSILSRTCTIWQKQIQHRLFPEFLNEFKFGRDKWLKIPGVKDVGEEPVLSADQVEKLKAKLCVKCPFFNEPYAIQAHRFEDGKTKKAWQTHMLILLPETINGQPRTANSIGKIFHFLKEGENETGYDYITGTEDSEFRKKPAPKSYFALVTKDVVPGSRRVRYEEKENLVKGKGYRVPTLSEAITGIVIMNLGSSEAKKGYFFGREGKCWTFTTTTEKYENWRLAVGGAAPSGLHVRNDFGGLGSIGVAAVEDVL
jgi:hypothetical protein